MRIGVQLSLSFVILVSAVLAFHVPAAAQSDWDPRDFRGIWLNSTRDITVALLPGEEIAFTRYGAEQHRSFDLKDYSTRGCLHKGLTRQLLSNALSMFTYDPALEMMIILHEDHYRWRAIYMDGRNHPPEVHDLPEPAGHSIGHWEGNTLVVDSIGFRDNTYLDTNGLGHSAELHIVERYTRTGPDTIEWVVTIEDPRVFLHPFTFQTEFSREPPDIRLMFYDCDYEQDFEHMESWIRGEERELHQNPEVFVFPD
jgi:hypothetical protein